MPTIPLPGCTPEPLMNYLKALGILRLVAEQVDPGARGFWRDGVFVLQTQKMDEAGLEDFLLRHYAPTPIVVPWSGNDFFATLPPKRSTPLRFKATPTGSLAIAAISGSSSGRFRLYRKAIKLCRLALKKTDIHKKEHMKGPAKARFLAALRGLSDQTTVSWIDASAVIGDDKQTFAAMMGSGGGSDGNTHFSDNFMQNLWDALPDFDSQRASKKKEATPATCETQSLNWLRSALHTHATKGLVEKRTSSLFDAGAVGGPNAGQGFERSSLTNPWNFILAIEGAVVFSGALSRRFGNDGASRASFPFQVRVSPVGANAFVTKEGTGRELWLPLWARSASYREIRQLLSEGRLDVGGRAATDGVGASRAVASLGIDRGISEFQRFAVLRGRVGGENYNTAAPAGRIVARDGADVTLLTESDRWVERLRRAAGDSPPLRIATTLRAIDRTVFEHCSGGTESSFGEIVVALGAAERVLASAPTFRAKSNSLRPLQKLSSAWVEAADDGSEEFEVALALAAMGDGFRRSDSIRTNLEPVFRDNQVWQWATRSPAVVWSARDLACNLSAVMSRRVMDAARSDDRSAPLASRHAVRLSAVSRFLAGELDETRIRDLLWGLVACDVATAKPACISRHETEISESRPIPREYALLKLLVLGLGLPTSLHEVKAANYSAALAMLNAGRIADACEVACRALRGARLSPLPHAMSGRPARDAEWADARSGQVDGKRIAAALLLPISHADGSVLQRLVLRPAKPVRT